MGLCLLVLDVIREQGNSIWGYLKNSYLGGRNKGVRLIKAVIKANSAVTHISQDKEMVGHICGLDNIHDFVYIQR